ncbi:MAG: ribosomal RNA small subunit methyltransferase A [Candidatus Magasanikbacteria bacterium]|nr:ribosomal RNA small subunit methyltransferase A [Candidatus Magasanikbacteria bacterium]
MSNIYNINYLQHLCQKFGLRPSKKYGQNYLIDPTVIETIIATAEIKKDDTVVEVGPGFGVLTHALAEKAGRVVAFEIEKKLTEYWNKITSNKEQGTNNIEIVWGNVLVSLRGGRNDRRGNPPVVRNNPVNKIISESGGIVTSRELLAMTPYKVVANLPYQITSPVIRLFLEADNPPEMMVLMVQKEVGERICAQPGDMSLLSVAVQYYADAKIIEVVPRSSFWPVPGVDSVVIKVMRRDRSSRSLLCEGEKESSPPLLRRGEGRERFVSFEQQFFHIVKAGFAQRRKLLIKNLEPIVGKKNRESLKEIFSVIGLTPQARAQELSVEQWRVLVVKVASL